MYLKTRRRFSVISHCWNLIWRHHRTLTFDIKALTNRTKDPVDVGMKISENKNEIGWILENTNRACIKYGAPHIRK